jgi:hypothetical protein
VIIVASGVELSGERFKEFKERIIEALDLRRPIRVLKEVT